MALEWLFEALTFGYACRANYFEHTCFHIAVTARKCHDNLRHWLRRPWCPDLLSLLGGWWKVPWLWPYCVQRLLALTQTLAVFFLGSGDHFLLTFGQLVWTARCRMAWARKAYAKSSYVSSYIQTYDIWLMIHMIIWPNYWTSIKLWLVISLAYLSSSFKVGRVGDETMMYVCVTDMIDSESPCDLWISSQNGLTGVVGDLLYYCWGCGEIEEVCCCWHPTIFYMVLSNTMSTHIYMCIRFWKAWVCTDHF